MRTSDAELSACAAFATFASGSVCKGPSEDAWNAKPVAQNCTRQAILAAWRYPFIIV